MRTTIMILLMWSTYVSASEIDINIIQRHRITDADVYNVSTWTSLQLTYKLDSPVYYFASQESVDVSPKGRSHAYTIQGIGVGLKTPASEHINIFGQFGVHRISSDWGERVRQNNEGLDYYLNSRWSDFLENGQPYQFDEYGVIHDHYTASIEVGFELAYLLTKNTSFGFTASYRGMRIKEVLRGYRDEWDYDQTGACWEIGTNRDYSSFNTGIGVKVTF